MKQVNLSLKCLKQARQPSQGPLLQQHFPKHVLEALQDGNKITYKGLEDLRLTSQLVSRLLSLLINLPFP